MADIERYTNSAEWYLRLIRQKQDQTEIARELGEDFKPYTQEEAQNEVEPKQGRKPKTF